MPLLLVLWGIALLSLISISLLGTSTTSQKLARNTLEAAQTEAVAEAAVVRTAIGLSDARPAQRWHADGRVEGFTLQGIQAQIRIQEELGRIDLNYADRGLLFGLLHSVGGVAVDQANKIVDSIFEWRTPIGSWSTGIQTTGAGSRSENNPEPRHGMFETVDELRLVRGVTPEIFKKIVSALTVYSQRQSVDPQLAPREVLLAMTGMTPERVAELLAQRRNKQSQGTNDAAQALSGRAFAVRIDIDSSSGKHSYEAVIRFTDDPNNFYWLLDWRDGSIIQ